MTYDPAKHEVKLDGAEFSKSDKEYQFRFVAQTLEDPKENESFKFKIKITFLNTSPSFLSPTVSQTVINGESLSWKLPRIVDAENDAVTKIVVKLGSNTEWINSDSD